MDTFLIVFFLGNLRIKCVLSSVEFVEYVLIRLDSLLDYPVHLSSALYL